MALCRILEHSIYRAWGWVSDGVVSVLDPVGVGICLTEPGAGGLQDLRAFRTSAHFDYAELDASGRLLPPTDETHEIWAAGVTYESSKLARMCEAVDGGDHYAKVYLADRPELFFKATPSRCVGQGGEVRLRADSHWNVPEPELAALISATGQILGYTIGNDMSSRDIEGANPLYLPQAKVYRGCCGLGPWVVPAQEIDPRNLGIELKISRNGATAFEGSTNTSRMRRSVEELAGWLFRENEFPRGVVMLTGTGIIPPDDFTLEPRDEVAITIKGIGTLRNRVAQQ
jgi:2-dehydro-3-deoxy-D-arabinonate dehydratase